MTTDIFQIRKDSPNGNFIQARVGQKFNNDSIRITAIYRDMNEWVISRTVSYKIVAEVVGREDAEDFVWQELINPADVKITYFIPTLTVDEMLKTILSEE